jgi:putative MATE family efflux protein
MIALQNAISFGVNLADTIMLGNYCDVALSGAAVSNQVKFLLQMATVGTCEGIVVLCSQYWGKKNTGPINPIISSGLKIGVSVAAVISIVSFFFPEQVLSLFTDKEDVIIEGAKYLKIVSLSYVFFSVTHILAVSLRSVEVTRLGVFVSLTGLVISISLNYVFIYGNFGAPELGARGAALTTLAARIIELLIVLIYIFKFDKRIRFKVRHIFSHNKQLFNDYIRAGLPVILSSISWAVGNGMQMAILGRLDDGVIAANAIAITIFQLFSVITYASASAAGIIIGKKVGSGELSDIKQYVRTFQTMFLCIGVMTGLGLFLSRDAILSIYNVSPESSALAKNFMTVLSVTVIGTAYQMPCLAGIVRGGGNTKFTLFNDMLFIWLVVIPSASISAFVLKLPPVIVYICLKCDQILKCAVAVVYVNSYRWIRKLARDNL